jgi:predicted nucleic acid-binding protein
MPAFSPDTSCMVAAVCGWHERHTPARAAIERRLRQAETMLVPGPALIEAYAVLTRLPAPHRLAADDARALLDSNFLELGRVVALDAGAYRTLVRRAAGDGITGGRTYDAVIAGCAQGQGHRAPDAERTAFRSIRDDRARDHRGRPRPVSQA